MEQKTINGMTRKEIEQKLSAPFAESEIKKDRNGFNYVEIGSYQKRMNEVLGVLNYDFEVDSQEIKTVGGKESVFLIGHITVRYDDGTECCRKSATGGTDIIVVKDTGKAKDSASDLKSALSDLFKACCKKLGVSDDQLRALKNEKSEGQTSKSAEEVTVKAFLSGDFKDLGGKGYSVTAKIDDGDVSLMFWSDAVKKVEEKVKFDKFVQIYTNRTITLVGKWGEYKGKKQFTVSNLSSAA